MKYLTNAILSLFLIIILLAVMQPLSAQTTGDPPQLRTGMLFPNRGVNCGIVDGKNGTNQCCISDLPNLRIPTKIGDIPFISDFFGTIMGALNGMIDSAPFFFLPTEVQDTIGLPNVGKIKKVMAKYPLCEDNGSAQYDKNAQNQEICTCVAGNGGLTSLGRLCNNIHNEAEKLNCNNCLTGSYIRKNPDGSRHQVQGIWTSLGCIETSSMKDFITGTIFTVGLGFAGVAAFFCIIYAALQLQLSQGNPERVKKSRELLTSCITGLLVFIFSVFILRVIGVDILRLPGFGK